MTAIQPLAHVGEETEEAGAQAARVGASSRRERIVAFLKERPMTDDELEVEWEKRYGRRTGERLCRRRHELKQLGVVQDSGDRRPSRAGVLNIVWSWTGQELGA